MTGDSPNPSLLQSVPFKLLHAALLPPLALTIVFGILSGVYSIPTEDRYGVLLLAQTVFTAAIAAIRHYCPSVSPRLMSVVLGCLAISLFSRLVFFALTRSKIIQEIAVLSRWDNTAAAVAFWACAIAAWAAAVTKTAVSPFPPLVNTTPMRYRCCLRCVSLVLSRRLCWVSAFICVAFCEYPFFTLLPRLCTATPALWLEDPALVLSSVRMQFLTSLLEVPPEKLTCVTSPPRYFVDPPTYERVPVDSLTDSGHLYAPTWDSGSPSTSNETCGGGSAPPPASGGPWWITDGKTMARSLMYYSKNKTILTLAFGGVEYVENALYSIDATSIDWKPGTEVDTDIFRGHTGGEGIVSVHRGFLLSYLALRGAVRDVLLNELQQQPATLRRFVISGHSMGAAMASLATLDLLSGSSELASLVHLQDPPAVLLFAPPHTGDASFVTAFNAVVKHCVLAFVPTDGVGHILDPQMGPVKGSLPVYPRSGKYVHATISLYDGLSGGAEVSWVVARTFVPVAAAFVAMALLIPMWLWLRHTLGLDRDDASSASAAEVSSALDKRTEDVTVEAPGEPVKALGNVDGMSDAAVDDAASDVPFYLVKI